uniref:NADH dehydrogenase subunit 3 n=1 Tax=Macrohectopus branickii TaxID=65455 RepID=UPI001D10CD47|nr:NADH dehydrogenase subunit 3 [Macrohectopus branickii]UCL27460.1 NADH dehydrogenase subunit 3 [Macrohectopus branickii]
MATIALLILVSMMVSSALALLALNMGKKSNLDREKMSPFECGFDPNKKARSPFSLRFFMLTIIFLIFDVEIVLLLPLGVLAKYSDPLMITITATILVLIIGLGLTHEWNQGALSWEI